VNRKIQNLKFAREDAQNLLLNEINKNGFWEGRLSSSPLAAAVAIVALAQSNNPEFDQAITSGLLTLESHINDDGGFGDSPESRSNLSTTLLCWSALNMASKVNVNVDHTILKIEKWLCRQMGNLDPETIAKSVLEFYGKDKTFSAPILVLCAIAGRLGDPARWDIVPQLPFELAAFPGNFYNRLNLNVVSYALPALIGIGLVRHKQRPSRFLPSTWIRNHLTTRLMTILTTIQPVNGGFLEATPLTSFVAMSLAVSGFRDLQVTQRCFDFILSSQRDDGSWPIDTNLSTWVTTLSVKALLAGNNENSLKREQKNTIRNWLLNQQFKTEHPFTKAAPGGWSWSDQPGAVPDADDTAGALLALHQLRNDGNEDLTAVSQGLNWLLNLQNRDGGIPTFCKGWGKLPFDQSCPDITAHALRAWAVWRDEMDGPMQDKLEKAIASGTGYLTRIQKPDGSWLPLWFGNQWANDERNPTYGTTQVLLALSHASVKNEPVVGVLLDKGIKWIIENQNSDGGWGSNAGLESTIEETSLAVASLAMTEQYDSLQKGVDWLIANCKNKETLPAAPIGLYFASLWYDEKLYPHIFAVQALNLAIETLAARDGRKKF